MASRPMLAGHLEQSDTAGRAYLVADATDLRFCDCAGLTALLQIHQRAAGSGGWLRVATATVRIRKLLRLIMLSQVLLCYSGIAEPFADLPAGNGFPVGTPAATDQASAVDVRRR